MYGTVVDGTSISVFTIMCTMSTVIIPLYVIRIVPLIFEKVVHCSTSTSVNRTRYMIHKHNFKECRKDLVGVE